MIMIKNTNASYGSIAKFLHWLIFILLAGMLIYGYFLDDFPKDVQPITYNIHKLIGLTILILMLLRLGWRYFNPRPELVNDVPHWQRKVERLVHQLMYLFVVVMPIVGWVGSAAAGHSPHLGSFTFNLPIEKNETIADVAFWLHNKTALIIIGLVCIHSVAALYHQFIKRDDIINKML
jgi:cytochrome b561